jgi:hypothetical protein
MCTHCQKPGLVTCDVCDQLVAPRGDHYSVHFAAIRDRAPCPRSYPKPVDVSKSPKVEP